MARFTSLEFMEALGLGYMDYNGAKILLRLLSSKGIAKEVGKVSLTGKGRPQVVYEIPEEVTIRVKPPGQTPSHETSRGACVPKRKKKVKVSDVVEAAMEAHMEDAAPQEVREIPAQEVQNQVHEEPMAAQPVTSSGEYEWDEGWDDDE